MPDCRRDYRPIQHAWGWSQLRDISDRHQLDEAVGYAGGESSIHLHRGKGNVFIVASGMIRVEYDHRPPYVMIGGGSLFVPVHSRHRLVFMEDSTLFELYLAAGPEPLDQFDIERFSEGVAPTNGLPAVCPFLVNMRLPDDYGARLSASLVPPPTGHL